MSKKKSGYQKPRLPAYLAPPHYNQQAIRLWKVRTQLSAAVNGIGLTAMQISGILGGFATSAVAGVYLCNQFRVSRITMWGPVATAGTPVSVQLKYADLPGSAGGIASNPKTVGDTSISFDRPAFCSLTPDKDSYFDLWLQTNNNSNYLVVTGPAGSIIDFDFEFLIDDIGSTNTTRALVGATLGVYYHLIATFTGAQTLTAVGPLNAI